jgi:hypothetical protein
MAASQLKRELQAIDEDAMGAAAARSFTKSFTVGESNAQMDALVEEYPSLSLAISVILESCVRRGASPDTQAGVLAGAVSMAVALKELVDTEELSSIPTLE